MLEFTSLSKCVYIADEIRRPGPLDWDWHCNVESASHGSRILGTVGWHGNRSDTHGLCCDLVAAERGKNKRLDPRDRPAQDPKTTGRGLLVPKWGNYTNNLTVSNLNLGCLQSA